MELIMEDRISKFREHIKQFPDSELARFALSKAYLDAGRTAEAVEELRKTIEIKPDYLLPHLLLAKAMVDLENPLEAKSFAQKAKQLAEDQNHEGPLQEAIDLLEEIG